MIRRSLNATRSGEKESQHMIRTSAGGSLGLRKLVKAETDANANALGAQFAVSLLRIKRGVFTWSDSLMMRSRSLRRTVAMSRYPLCES